jgi:hypothetical protein
MAASKLGWIADTNEVNGYRGNGLTATAGRVVYQVFANFNSDYLTARYRIRGRRWPRWTVLGNPHSILEALELCECHHATRNGRVRASQ